MTATPTAITIDEVSWQDNKNDCIIGNSHDKRQETRQSQLTWQYAWFFFTVSSFYIPPKNTGNVFLWVLEKVLLKRPVLHFSKKLFHENIFCFLTNFLNLLSFFSFFPLKSLTKLKEILSFTSCVHVINVFQLHIIIIMVYIFEWFIFSLKGKQRIHRASL